MTQEHVSPDFSRSQAIVDVPISIMLASSSNQARTSTMPAKSVPAASSVRGSENRAPSNASSKSSGAAAVPDARRSALLARLFAGADFFKYHQNSLSPSEIRTVRVFRAADVPKGSTIEKVDDSERAPPPALDAREIYIGYAHVKRTGLMGSLLGSGSKDWRLFPLSGAEWARTGHLSPIFNRALKQGLPLPAQELCFSILFAGGSKTIGLSATDAAVVRAWVSGLKAVIAEAKAAVFSEAAAAKAKALEAEQAKKAAAAEKARQRKAAEDAIAYAEAAAVVGTGADGEWSDADTRSYYQKTLFPAIRAGRVEDVILAFEGGCPTDLIEDESRDNALLAGARVGDVRIVKIALHAAVPFMPHGPSGDNALQLAIVGGSLSCVEAIMRMAADAEDEDQARYVLSLKNADGDTPLHQAAAAGLSDITKCLLRYSITEVSTTNASDATPIHLVCRSAGSTFVNGVRRPVAVLKSNLVGGRGSKVIDYEATLSVLLKAALSLKALPRILRSGDASGAAPLHLSAAGGSLGLTALLLQAGAPVRLRTAFTAEEPYEIAVGAGHNEVADAILAASTDAEDAGEADVTDAARAAYESEGAAVVDEAPTVNAARARVSSIATDAGVAEDAATAAAGGGLPGGGGAIYIHPWLQCFDPNSGYAYWFNTETSESVWEAPEDVASKLEALGYNGAFIEGGETAGGLYGNGVGVEGGFCSGFGGVGAAGRGVSGSVGGGGFDGIGVGGANGAAGIGGVGGGGGGGAGGGGGGGGTSGGGGVGNGASAATSGGPLSPGGTVQWVGDDGAVGSASGATSFRATGARIGGVAPGALEHEGVAATGMFSPGKGRALPYTPRGIPEGTVILGSDDLDGASFVDAADAEGVSAILVAGRDAASIASGRVLVLPAHLHEKRYATPGKSLQAAPTIAAPAEAVAAPEVAPAPVAPSPKAIDILAFPVLGRYARMVRMGVPAAPVLEKMRADGVDSNLVDSFGLTLKTYLAGGGTSLSFGSTEAAAPPPAAAETRPEAAPVEKVAKPKAVEETPLAAPVSAPAETSAAPIAGDNLFSDERVSKFAKMLRMGVPLPPTLLKMRSEGIDAALVTAFEAAVAAHAATGSPMSALGTSAAPAPAAAAPAPPVSPRNTAKSAAEVQREAADAVAAEPVFEKFVKMKKMGVPLGAIKGRMQQDGITNAQIKLFLSAFATHAALQTMGLASPDKNAPAALSAVSPPKARLNRERGAVPTTKIHWDALKLDDAALKKSLWGRIGADATDDLESEDAELLSNMFAAAKAPTQAGGGAAEAATSAAPEKLHTLLDFKRANNLNISLAQFRKFSHEKLFAAVYRLDKAALPREVLEKLMLVLPTADEIKLLRAYKGKKDNLMECDKFVAAVAHVPRFGAKVSAFSASLFVASAAADVEKRILLLTGACAQLMESTRLQSVLACVLRLGNTLNAGSKLGGAAAISLESLVKLPATKAADKKTTLMDALVMLVDKKFGADMLQWAEDTRDTTPAARIELSEVRGEVARLRAAVLAAKEEADAEDADITKDEAAIAALAADDADGSASKADAPAAAPAPVAPVETDPRKAMLAQMMLKRAGGGGASAGGAAAPALVKAKPAVLSTNPCALGDRRLFVSGIRAFVKDVETTLSTLDSLVGVAARASSDLAEYFGEDHKTTPPSRVFLALKNFADSFASATVAHMKKKAALAKAAAAGAAAGGATSAVAPVAAVPPAPPVVATKAAAANTSASAAPIRATLPRLGGAATAALPPPPPK